MITTERPGTTRSNVLGVVLREGLQLAFTDTPGVGLAKTALHHVLADQAREALAGVDALCVLVEAHRSGAPHKGDEKVYQLGLEAERPIVVAVNKVDRLANKSALLPVLQAWGERERVKAVVPISALDGTGLDGLVMELGALMPGGVLYEDDVLTDRPIRFFAAELIREAVLRHTTAEVPYGVAVQLDRFSEEGPLVRIDATVHVEKDSHKAIVIGKGGARLKQVGTEARVAIEELTERRVFLKLWVKVARRWTEDPTKARALSQETDR